MASIDASVKRFYPAVICGLLGTIAYLQGAGISSLVAEQLPAAAGPLPHGPIGAPAPGRGSDRSASPILSRNAFDSATGPLDAAPKPPAPPPEPVHQSATAELPRCPTGTVVGITDSDDPGFSFALIRTSGPAKMRRIGDDVDGKKLEAIGWDRVVLGGGASRCELRMLDETGAKPGGASTPEPPPRDGARGAPPTSATTTIGDITKVSETEYVIEKGSPEKMTQMQQAFMKSARVVEGQGIRLQRSAQTTVLGQLGMKKGDLVKTINGFDMTNPDKSMEAYAKMKTSKKVQVVLERDGQPVTLDYTLK